MSVYEQRRSCSPVDRLLATCSFVVAMAAHAQPSLAQEATVHPALNSYGQPPFAALRAGGTTGLARAFVDQLNKESGPRQRFELQTLPRRRLEVALDDARFAGVALFLAPEFLQNASHGDGHWSVPVMIDENLLVSVRPLTVDSLDALSGKRFGAIAGHVYRVLSPLIDAGRIERSDTADHLANLGKLCLGRVDFVVMSRSEFAGNAPLVPCSTSFKPMPFPQPQVIVRRVLVRMPGGRDSQAVLDAIGRVACGEEWLSALAAYGLTTVGCARKAMSSASSGGTPATRR